MPPIWMICVPRSLATLAVSRRSVLRSNTPQTMIAPRIATKALLRR